MGMMILRSAMKDQKQKDKKKNRNAKVKKDKDSSNNLKKMIEKKEELKLKEAPADSDSDFEDEEEESDFEDEEDFFEEIFELPSTLKKDDKLKLKFDKLVKRIKEKEPNLENILKLKIRFKRKVELVQSYFIYKNSYYPHTEEKLFYRNEMIHNIKLFEKEFIEFKENKALFLKLEKTDRVENDLMLLKGKLMALDTTQSNLELLYQKFNTLENRENGNEDYYKLLTFLKNALKLPYNTVLKIPCLQTDICRFMNYMREELDKNLYGMHKCKEKLMVYVHNKLISPLSMNTPLGLVGEPGLGKTSIALCLSKILNMGFQQISLGGVTDSSFLIGHDYTYIGSKPGRLASAMQKLKASNGIIFLDEFDKASQNSDMVNSLLHIMDGSQNRDFKDSYFGDLSIDLSRVWFVCSMNKRPTEKALADRISYIEIDEYTEKDKREILLFHLLPKALANMELEANDICIEPEVADYFVRKISPNSGGIRKLKDAMGAVISKLIFVKNNPRMDVSFSLTDLYKNHQFQLVFPIKLSKKMIDILLEEFIEKPNASISNLYL